MDISQKKKYGYSINKWRMPNFVNKQRNTQLKSILSFFDQTVKLKI